MSELSGQQKKYLRGIAHHLKPIVQIGQKGITQTLRKAVSDSLATHELIKVKFVDIKDRKTKSEWTDIIVNDCQGQLVGTIGHVVILFRPNPSPEKRKIVLPENP